jgi:hypothetical protein
MLQLADEVAALVLPGVQAKDFPYC